MRYLCEGYTRPEIAAHVFRTPSTIGSQIESIARKLSAHSAAEIVSTAVAAHLVRIEITDEHTLFQRLVAVLLMFNVVGGHIDMRRPPRTPRPVARIRLNTRAVRNQSRFQRR